MFAVEEIEKAMSRIFELFALEEVGTLLEEGYCLDNVLEPDVLAEKFRKSASDVYLFLHSSGPEDNGIKRGKCLFDQKAAFVDTFSHERQRIGGNEIHSDHELWLLEDMTFAHVCCIRTLKLEGEQVTSVTECRTLVGFIGDQDDLFFDVESFLESLDEIALFAGYQTE